MDPVVQPSVVSLFAGIGGFDLGFDSAGFRIVAHVEKDANCRKLLGEKWPDAVCLDDVCTAGAHNLPPCDVVTFGFPCQDLSVAGKRAGLAGGRSGLFYEATRIIDELKPAYCLFENVPGLLSSDGGRDFWRVLRQMDEIGYHGAWRTLDAQWFGVAQRRRRVFGLFSRLNSGAERCAKVLSLGESLRGHPAPSREAGKVAPCLAASGVGAGRTGNERNKVDFCIEQPVAMREAGQGYWMEDKVSGTLQAASGGDSIQRPAVIGVPQVSKSIRTRTGGIDREDMHTLIPEVAGCLQERDAKGPDSDTKPGHLVPCYGIDEEQNAAENLMGCLKARKEGGGFEAAVAFHPTQDPISHADGSTHAMGTGSKQGCATVAVAYEPYHDEHDGRGVNFRPTEVHQTLRGPHGADNALIPITFKPNQSEQARSIDIGHDIAGTLAGAGGGNGLSVAAPISFQQNQLGEVRTSDVAGTVNTNSNASGRNTAMAQVAMSVRRLTPTECERLQGLPDGWTAGFADSTRYKMLGNAVCQTVSFWIAKRLMAAMQQEQKDHGNRDV